MPAASMPTTPQPGTPTMGAAAPSGSFERTGASFRWGAAPLLKGHGTGRDFLVLIDAAAEASVGAATVRELCDRYFGVGADGFIHAVRSNGQWTATQWAPDGAVVDVCAAGLRVLTHALRLLEHEPVADGASTVIGTRAGDRQVVRHGDLYTVDMGRWRYPGGEQSLETGADALVASEGLVEERAALQVEVCGSHAVVALAQEAELLSLRLSATPLVEPATANVTVEYVVPLGEEDVAGVLVGTARMRVFEDGAGETRSGGAGSCAAALALNAWGGADAPKVWRLLLPGGEESVRIVGERVEVTGSAQLVARIETL